jgi:hypothetical protein
MAFTNQAERVRQNYYTVLLWRQMCSIYALIEMQLTSVSLCNCTVRVSISLLSFSGGCIETTDRMCFSIDIIKLHLCKIIDN